MFKAKSLLMSGLVLAPLIFAVVCLACAPEATQPPPAPAAFKINKLTVDPGEVKVGEQVTVTAEVNNTGGAEGSYTVELKINDATEKKETVSVPPKSSSMMTFVISRDNVGTYKISVDGLTEELIVKAKTIRIEDTDPAFVYSPGWKTEQNEGASSGSWTMTHLGAYGYADQKVDVKFKGTGVSLVYLVGHFGGIADIKIGGKDYPRIDMYAPTTELKVTSIATDLTNTDHILTISPSKDSNPSASLPSGGPTKPMICIDAIDVIAP